ncbi:Uncharacterized protein NV38_0003582 [Leptospira kirschneri serovar Mozdok]|nr:Uncharacterized protein NV38_0003582 [Leptospira kirschneri serovar Mozdok]
METPYLNSDRVFEILKRLNKLFSIETYNLFHLIDGILQSMTIIQITMQGLNSNNLIRFTRGN